MKTVLRSLVLVAFAASAHAATITAKVDGMVCAFCVQGIVYQFEQLPEVKHVKVDLDTQTVTITTYDGKTLKEDDVKKTITDAGFDSVSINIEP